MWMPIPKMVADGGKKKEFAGKDRGSVMEITLWDQ